MQKAIEAAFSGITVTSRDASLIDVQLPEANRADPVGFLAQLEALTVTPDTDGRVVINAANGVIVMGEKVRIGKVAVSYRTARVTVGGYCVEPPSTPGRLRHRGHHDGGRLRLRPQGRWAEGRRYHWGAPGGGEGGRPLRKPGHHVEPKDRGTHAGRRSVNNSYSYPAQQLAGEKAVRSTKRASCTRPARISRRLFIKQMLDVMRKTIHKEDDMLGGGLGQDVYEDMLYDEYAKKMAATAQFGLADMIYSQVSSK